MVAFGLPAAAGQSEMSTSVNRYGGPTYLQAPNLQATAALVKAGGGAQDFSIETALKSMVGDKLVDAEVAKLTKQYGAKAVTEWVNGFDFAVDDAVKVATKDGVILPAAPTDLSGAKLAAALVQAGVDPKTNVYWSGLMYDKALSHGIHDKVMDDIDAKYGATQDLVVHKITNQAMYDLAQALGAKNVKLATLH